MKAARLIALVLLALLALARWRPGHRLAGLPAC
jgi:hypothetical protein